MNRRLFALGAALAATPLLSGFGWDKHFDLSWEEEVLLHDGRVIVVKLKNTYERLHPGLTRYGGTNLTRDTTLTFDAGGTTGLVTQLFKGFHPLFIGQYEGAWYVSMYGGNYYRSEEIPGQNWGLGWYDCPNVAKLVGAEFKPISVHDLPSVFKQANIMLLYGTAEEHAKFNGRRITLANKVEWLARHPPGSGHGAICRPPKGATRPASLFEDLRTLGENK